MSSRKRKQSVKKEDGEEDSNVNDIGSDNSEVDAKNATGSEGTDNKEQTDNGGVGGGETQDASVSGPSTTDSGEGVEQVTDGYFTGEEDKPEKKKFRLQGSEHSGTLLFCGGTNWDLIGRRELPKNAKGAVGRNLWGPHRLKALSGTRVRTVISGNASCHSVIITEEGRLMTWGRNDKGQLGHGDTKRRDNPSFVEELKDVIAVDAACGRSHTMVLSDHGHVYSFGDNKLGQCGVGNQTSGVIVPTKAPLMCVADHGHLYTFGDNKSGQCGTGSNSQIVSTPHKISFKGRPVSKIACGAEFSMIVDFKGYLFSFGSPEYGQLGHNTDGRYFVTNNKLAFSCELVPRRIGVFIEKTREGHIIPIDDVRIASVACGCNHTVAMDDKKRCYTWGFGGYGRLGHSEPKDEMVPRLVKFFDGPNRGVKAVAAGGTFSMAVSEHGCLYFWGQNKVGGEATMYPKPVHDLSGWQIRAVGCSNRSIVVLADQSVISWGPSPTYGELGYGDSKPKSSTTPQEVKPLDNVHIYSVACGFGHTLLIAKDESEEDQTKLKKFPEYAP